MLAVCIASRQGGRLMEVFRIKHFHIQAVWPTTDRSVVRSDAAGLAVQSNNL
jgi:hypothetical protein